MKIIKILFLTMMVLSFGRNLTQAQTLNWASFNRDQRNILNINAGVDYSFTYGIGYGYQLKTKLPVLLNVEYSQAAGENLFDDFKTKIGGQIRIYEIDHFHFTAKVQGIFRRFEDDYVRMLNFGSDMSVIAGYYKSRWFVAGEFGFDKAIVTHFKHSDISREDFPGIKDGWYEPSTGGNFYYGLQAGYSFHQYDIMIKAGQVVQQDFETHPSIPFYLHVGFNKKF